MLCGFVTIPFASLISGVVMGLPFLPFLITLLPLFLFAIIIVIGLLFAPEFTAKVFSVIGFCIKGLATIGLTLGIIEVLLGVRLIQNVGEVKEGAWICFRAAITLSGAFPLMRIISLLLSKPLNWVSRKTGLNSVSTIAFVSTLVSSSTIFDTMHKMDKKGVFLNSAFLVSASFVVGGHLAFTMAYNADYVLPMILTKLLGGVMALGLAILLANRLCKPESQEGVK
jgi:ethanolamine transporter